MSLIPHVTSKKEAILDGKTAPRQPLDTGALQSAKQPAIVMPNNAPATNYMRNILGSKSATIVQDKYINQLASNVSNAPVAATVTKIRMASWIGARFTS